MSGQQARRRVDANHAAIVEAFRAHGWSVQSLAAIGKGCPDLLVGKGGYVFVAEVKTERGRLTKDEQAWIDAWPCLVFLVRASDDVAAINRWFLGHQGASLVGLVCERTDTGAVLRATGRS